MTNPHTTGPERMPPLEPGVLNPAQRKAYDALVQGPRGKIEGPFIPMLRSPGFMDRAQQVGAFIRYESVLPAVLRELAILVTARVWDQAIEWSIHAPIAQADGLSLAAIAALAEDRRPDDLTEAEAAVHDYCFELHRTQGVSDELYARTLALLGEEALMDLTGLCGYYAMLAMIMNVARTPLPAGEPRFKVPA